MLIFSCWIIIGNIFEVNYRKENLNKISGKITGIKEVRIVNTKRNTDYELRLYLKSNPAYFRITDNYKYHDIQNELKSGDEVQIYFRPKYLALLGFGNEFDIYQLEYKNRILFDLEKRKENSKGLIIIGLISFSMFGTAYYFVRKLQRKSYS